AVCNSIPEIMLSENTMRPLIACLVVVLSLAAVGSTRAEDPPTFLFAWGTQGSGDGQFYRPTGIALDDSGYVYVVDSSNGRIEKFDATGNFIRKWGTPGTGDGQFAAPQGIAVSRDGSVYVTDYTNHRIQKFTRNGAFVSKWG